MYLSGTRWELGQPTKGQGGSEHDTGSMQVELAVEGVVGYHLGMTVSCEYGDRS